MASPVLRARSRLGVAARTGSTQATIDARRDLAAAKLEQYIESVVAAAPPLTDAQKSRLTALLGGGA